MVSLAQRCLSSTFSRRCLGQKAQQFLYQNSFDEGRDDRPPMSGGKKIFSDPLNCAFVQHVSEILNVFGLILAVDTTDDVGSSVACRRIKIEPSMGFG